MATRRRYARGIIVNHAVEGAVVVRPPPAAAPIPDILNRFDRYDVLNDSWETMTSMSKTRAGHAQFTVDGYVYAIGGVDGQSILKSVEEYDIIEDEWNSKTSMSNARCFFASAESNGFIYVVGGVSVATTGAQTLSTSLERYDALTDEWVSLADMPEGVAFGVAQIVNDKMYVLGGYATEMLRPSSKIFVYNISDDTWDTFSLSGDELALYRRLLPFSFVKDDYIYVLDGLLYEQDITIQPPVISKVYMTDSYRIDTTDSTPVVARADRFFEDAPRPRYAGGTASIDDTHYFLGGVNPESNTLRYFESVDTSASPFSYSAFTKLERGRSLFGCSSYYEEYGEFIYVSGGILSKQGEKFLNVEVNAVPDRIRLDGKQTGSVDIRVFDENGDAPEGIKIRLTTQGGAPGSTNSILFVNDQITLESGYGIATLLPRADDGESGISMSDATVRGYGITVKASIVDAEYFGETEPAPSPPPSGSPSGPIFENPPLSGGGELPSGVTLLKKYSTVVRNQQQNPSSYIGFINLGGIINFTPTSSGGTQDASINFYSDIRWLPVVKQIINDNAGTYERMIDAIDRLSREEPFGGSNLLDGMERGIDVMEFDITGAKKLLFVQGDGEENGSNASQADVLDRIAAVSGSKMFPVVSSVYRVVPEHLHLDQSIRDGSPILESVASQTGGSTNYVVTDSDTERSIEMLLQARGFIGSGFFSCEIDLGEESRIESIQALFDIPAETLAYWRYSVGNDDKVFSLTSDRVEANETLTLFETEGRYIRLFAEFYSALTADTYNAEPISPPRLTSVDIIYHKKTTSHIFLTPEDTDAQTHNVVVTLDADHSRASSINVGTTSAKSTSWADYGSEAQPTVDNSTRIVVPIRKAEDPRELYTLEPLVSVDGFIFEAKYGKWAADSTVKVYTEDGSEISNALYRVFPHKGYVVFDQRRTAGYLIEIRNQKNISVAAEIINRVNGDAAVLMGAGYMYSTTAPKVLTQDASNILPEAINLLLMPLNPNKDSVFIANYTFYDIRGRDEKESLIKWYVNNEEQPDIFGLKRWDNKEWKLAETGDVIYFTITPKSADATGRITRCAPIRLS